MKRLLPALLLSLLLTGCALGATPIAPEQATPQTAPTPSQGPAAAGQASATPTCLTTREDQVPWPHWWQGTGVEALLPSDTQAAYSQLVHWVDSENEKLFCVVVPYRWPDQRISLMVAKGPRAIADGPAVKPFIHWDWQQEEIAPRYWQEICLRGTTGDHGRVVVFLGLDEQGKWWVILIGGGPSPLQLLLPIPHPDKVSVHAEVFKSGDEQRVKYWLWDGDRLALYGWDGKQAIAHWSADNAQNILSTKRQLCDFTGDGWDDLVVQGEGQAGVTRIYQATDKEFKLVGEIEPGYSQYTDVDGDGMGDFLWADPPDAPTAWRVYGWNGERFVWKEPLARPPVLKPAALDRSNLPPLPADLYFQGSQPWLWPRQGGPLQPANAAPPTATPASCQYLTTPEPPTPIPTPCKLCGESEAGETWSPDCRFALVEIVGWEWATYDLVSADRSQRWPVPNARADPSGSSEFAWDPNGKFLLHTDMGALYRTDLDSGQTQRLLCIGGYVPLPAGWPTPDCRSSHSGWWGAGAGVSRPVALADGSILFALSQGCSASYPPEGIYCLSLAGELRLLASVPPTESVDYSGLPRYGSLLASPDGSMFIYQVPAGESAGPPYSALLLGKTDGSALWDLMPLAGDATDFWWQ